MYADRKLTKNRSLGCLRLRALAAKTGFGSMKIGFRLAFYEMVLDLSSLVRDRNSLTSFFSISRLIITLRHLIISHYISTTPPPTTSKRSKILISKLKFCLFKKNTHKMKINFNLMFAVVSSTKIPYKDLLKKSFNARDMRILDLTRL